MVGVWFANPARRQRGKSERQASKISRPEAGRFNHRSTGVKPAGARMNRMAGSGAKSLLRRHKVGGGKVGSGAKMRPLLSGESKSPCGRRWICNANTFLECASHACALFSTYRATRSRREAWLRGGKGWSMAPALQNPRPSNPKKDFWILLLLSHLVPY